MAPSLRNNKKNIKNDLQLDKYENVKKTIKSYQKFIKENFKFVGENFGTCNATWTIMPIAFASSLA